MIPVLNNISEINKLSNSAANGLIFVKQDSSFYALSQYGNYRSANAWKNIGYLNTSSPTTLKNNTYEKYLGVPTTDDYVLTSSKTGIRTWKSITSTIPVAADGVRGGIQIGYQASGANIPVLISSEKAYVSLTKTAIEQVLTGTITTHSHTFTQSYPAVGIANSTGTAWGTSYTTTGSGSILALSVNPVFTGVPTVRNAVDSNSLFGFYSENTVRWNIGKDSATETGSNVGANFAIYSYADNGAYLAAPFTINRAAGGVTIASYLGVGGAYNSSYALTVTGTTYASTIVGASSSSIYNTGSTTITAFGAATTMTIGGTPTTAITHNYSTNATANATTKIVNIGTGGVSGSTTNIYLGSSTSGANNNIYLYGAVSLTSTITALNVRKTAPTTLSSSTPAWDMNTSSVAHLTLSASVSLTISNAIAGDFGTLKVVQGAGSYTLTLPSGSKKTSTITISTTNGAIDILSFYYDGTNYFWNHAKNYT